MFSATTADVEHVSLLWSENDFFGVARSINISSLRDEEKSLEIPAKKTMSWSFVLQRNQRRSPAVQLS